LERGRKGKLKRDGEATRKSTVQGPCGESKKFRKGQKYHDNHTYSTEMDGENGHGSERHD